MCIFLCILCSMFLWGRPNSCCRLIFIAPIGRSQDLHNISLDPFLHLLRTSSIEYIAAKDPCIRWLSIRCTSFSSSLIFLTMSSSWNTSFRVSLLFAILVQNCWTCFWIKIIMSYRPQMQAHLQWLLICLLPCWLPCRVFGLVRLFVKSCVFNFYCPLCCDILPPELFSCYAPFPDVPQNTSSAVCISILPMSSHYRPTSCIGPLKGSYI